MKNSVQPQSKIFVKKEKFSNKNNARVSTKLKECFRNVNDNRQMYEYSCNFEEWRHKENGIFVLIADWIIFWEDGDEEGGIEGFAHIFFGKYD
jgi:hypothetical protein